VCVVRKYLIKKKTKLFTGTTQHSIILV